MALCAVEGPGMQDSTSARKRAGSMPLAVIGVEVGTLCGTGRIFDASGTGLRIEDANVEPCPGDPVLLRFAVAVDEPSFEVHAEVVRRTESGGFAVKFMAPGPAAQRMLDCLVEAVAVKAVPASRAN